MLYDVVVKSAYIIFFSFHISTQFLAHYKKNSYRIRIKVRWCRDTILRKKFWKFIPHMHAYSCANLRTPAHNCAHPAHPCTPAHTHQTPMHTRTQPSTPAHTCAHPRTPAYTQVHPRTPKHTRAHPHTSLTYPLMPADALNLINQMNYM